MQQGHRIVVVLITTALVAAAGPGFTQTEDPDLVQVAKLVPFVELFEDHVKFGHSVSMDGDLMVVGASGEDALDQNSGAAYVFVKAAGDWYLQTKLVPSDGAAFDEFGFSVAIDGLTVVVGAPEADGPLGDDQGAAYVFARSTDGRWTEMAKLTAADGGANENFGHSVAASGDTVMVGAWKHGATAYLGGAAYVYERSGPDWPLQQKLESDDLQIGDLFGTSVAIEGDTAVVGAQYDDHPGGNGEGSAYVFTRAGTVWTQQQRLYAADAAPGDHFASSLAISGSTIVAGTWEDDHAAGDGAGSAYAFIRSGNVWGQQQKLVADDAAAGDAFGYAVDVEGDLAVVGAVFDDDIALDGGSAYVFERSGGFWSQRQELPGDVVNGDLYGCAVAISGDTFAAGARDDDTFGGVDSGSVTTYKLVSDVWTWGQGLSASTPPNLAQTGRSVAIEGDTLIVGQRNRVQWQTDQVGAAHLFTWLDSQWVQTWSFIDVGGPPDRFFGLAVAVDGDTAVIGAPYFDDSSVGQAEIFVRSGSFWSRQAILQDDHGIFNNPTFGNAVDLEGDTLVVGAVETWNDDLTERVGSAVIFERSGDSWNESGAFRPNSDIECGIGADVAISGDTVFIGAPYADPNYSGTEEGMVYVMSRTGATWSHVANLTATNPAAGDWFGRSVDIDGDTAVIGGPQQDQTAGGDEGAAYVFTRSGATWTQQQVLVADDGSTGDQFGWDVAIDGDTILVGAPWVDGLGDGHGATYVFTRSGNTWTLQQKLTTSGSAGTDFFGYSVDLAGDRIVAGAPTYDLLPAWDEVGATYVFGPNLGLPFSDGFESGDISAWSFTVP